MYRVINFYTFTYSVMSLYRLYYIVMKTAPLGGYPHGLHTELITVTLCLYYFILTSDTLTRCQLTLCLNYLYVVLLCQFDFVLCQVIFQTNHQIVTMKMTRVQTNTPGMDLLSCIPDSDNCTCLILLPLCSTLPCNLWNGHVLLRSCIM